MTEDRIPDLSTVVSPPRRNLDYRSLAVADDPIGAGGDAVVYEARIDGSEGARIALKEPAESGTMRRDTIESFLSEAETWAQIDRREREKHRWADSEHVVGIVDTGERLPWIAMEYMDSGSLAERLDDEPDGLAVDEALWIGECLCRGVEVAHSYGVAHLDLKPGNVLFRETPDDSWDVPKIADWGLARVLTERTTTVDGLSVRYAAPEQFDPERFGDPDTLTDIYQLGTVVYALLTGRAPYVGSHTSVMYGVIDDEPPAPPNAVREAVPETVGAVVATALATDKRDRYDAVQTFKRALHAVRTGDRPPQVATAATTDSTGFEGKTSRGSSDEEATPQQDTGTVDAASTESTPDATSTKAERPGDERTAADESPADERPEAPSAEQGSDSADRDPDGAASAERDEADRWFDPADYPEASTQTLAEQLRAERDAGGASSIAAGLRENADPSLASNLRRLRRSANH